MSRSLGWCFAFCALVLAAVAGCNPGVREDRAITFAPDGGAAFQHGTEGVFITDGEGPPRKIFQPGPDVVAVSPPLWAPSDRRLLFTTARRVGKNFTPVGEADPAGNLYAEGETVYTCWLRAAPDGDDPRPEPLFEAPCEHPGYVAANLAVRWDQGGKRVLHVRRTAKGRHALFTYDLATKATTRIFPHEAAGLAFAWSPGNRYVACALAEPAGSSSPHAGLWIGRPGEEGWWRVPGSEDPSSCVHPLDQARGLLPDWAPGDDRLAFAVVRPTPKGSAGKCWVIAAAPARRRAEVAAEDTEPFHDVHWRPDGSVLGAVAGSPGRLVRIDPAKGHARPEGPENVVNFAGWDAAGGRLAYTTREPVPGAKGTWAFLFIPEPAARMAVCVRDEGASGPGRRLLGGLQVTFPRWASAGPTLSLWATFRAPWRSWPTVLMEMGSSPDDPLRGLRLRPGDPAVLVDSHTGALSWKAADPGEEVQLGHYHLLRREYAQAWHRYERVGDAGGPGVAFFHYYCLEKMGKHEEAGRELRRFGKTFLDSYRTTKRPTSNGPPSAPFGAAGPGPSDEMLRHWQDLYAAEVFLALDAAADGEVFFRKALADARTDDDRLSKALVAGQFLLLSRRNAEYAELATDTVLPLLYRSWKPHGPGAEPLNNAANALLAYSDGLSLVPLFAPEFLAGLSRKQVSALIPRWEKARGLADDDVKRLGIDLFLAAAHARSGHDDEARRARERVAANPVAKDLLGDGGVTGLVKGLRSAPEIIEQLRQLFARR
jgi:hypothetical protein